MMFRSTIQLKTLSNISKRKPNHWFRYYSTNSEKGNTAKVGLIIGSSVVVLSGLTIGYARYDPQFRKKFQNSVPFSEKLFNSLFGPLIHNKDSIISAIDKTKDEKIESFLSKRREREGMAVKAVDKSSNNNNNEKLKTNKIDDKSKDSLHEKQPNIETNDSKTDNNSQTMGTDIPQKFAPEESDTTDEATDKSTDDSVSDIDVLIAREALRDQLMTILPTDDEKLKELQKRCNDIELEYQRKITKLEEKAEKDLKLQLKRQLSAFNDHLDDQLSNLRHRLKRDFDNSLEEKLMEEKNRFHSELSDSFYRLQTLDQIIKAREQLEKDQHSVRELWVLCQALRDALRHRPAMSEECIPIPLTQPMSAIQSILNKDSLKERPVIRCALESIPKDVIQRGIYSEEDLIKRFTKVDKYCKRVALIGDNGATLYRYLLSYIQSILIFTESKIPKEELDDQEVDPSKWDTFDVLTRVRHCLNNHNLEMALKYANQLKGAARNVAKDWISDTRTHLEVKQAVDLLQTEANAINVQIIN